MTPDRARDIMQAASPALPALHLLPSATGGHVFLADGSRLFEVEAPLFAELETARLSQDRAAVDALMQRLGLDGAPFVDDMPVQDPPLQAISGGKVVLGIGAGWNEEEYLAYGWPYPRPRVRIAQLAEAIQEAGLFT